MMDNVQERNNCTNLPPSQTFRSYLLNVLVIHAQYNTKINKGSSGICHNNKRNVNPSTWSTSSDCVTDSCGQHARF
jgi:hypothetical protein